MALQSVKKFGQSVPVLKSFRWTKPGIAEAQVVQEGVVDGDGNSAQMPLLPIPMALEGYNEEWKDGICTRTWIYRAGKPIPASPSDPNGDAPDEVWSCDVTLQDRPLTSHPNIDTIMSTYGGVLKSGILEFPPRMADGSINPLYMVESYLAPTIQVSREKAYSGAGVSVSGIGKLGQIDNPSGGFGFVSSAAGEWLLTDHVVRKEGNDTSEKKVWKWGGFGGWLRQIYDKGYWGGA